MNKKIIIIILMVFILILTGCQSKIHTKEDLILHANKLNYPFGNIKIKKHFTILDEVHDKKNGKDHLLLKLRLDNYNIDFFVESIYACIFNIETSCDYNYYEIHSNYEDVVGIYLSNIFEKANPLPICKMVIREKTTNCYLTELEQVDSVADYIEKYRDFVKKYKISDYFINHITINKNEFFLEKNSGKYYLSDKNALYKTNEEVKELLTGLID